jgi:hypothetical protein
VGIVVANLQTCHFGAADAGGVEEFEHGAVAQAEGAGDIGQREQAVDLVQTERLRQGAGLLPWQVEIGRGVGGQNAVAAQPGEEAADAASNLPRVRLPGSW